jgi:transposase-like protein
MSAKEKLRVVEEGRQSGATVSEVCRRHQVSHAQFYRWERLARQGALEALRNGARRAKNGKHEEWLISQVNRLRTVVAEVTAENLTLKRGGLGLKPHRRYPEEEKGTLRLQWKELKSRAVNSGEGAWQEAQDCQG